VLLACKLGCLISLYPHETRHWFQAVIERSFGIFSLAISVAGPNNYSITQTTS
jgi:hypothetical protein